MTVIAEGIEEESQAKFCEPWAVTKGRGFCMGGLCQSLISINGYEHAAPLADLGDVGVF